MVTKNLTTKYLFGAIRVDVKSEVEKVNFGEGNFSYEPVRYSKDISFLNIKIFKKTSHLIEAIENTKAENKSIGFTPKIQIP